MKQYPKILLVGPNFSTRKGEGITLTNLFTGWPKDRIAVASDVKDFSVQSDVCNNYYQFGTEELYWAAPFSVLQSHKPSGKIPEHLLNAKNGNALPKKKVVNKSFKQRIRTNISRGLSSVDLYHQFYRFEASAKFMKWVEEFDPDYIYTNATGLDNIRFILDLLDKRDTKLIVHIMDDYLASQNQFNVTHGFWKKHMDNSFQELLSRADILLTICKEMSDEYLKRYKKQFSHFHNPVTLDKWQAHSRTNWEQNGTFNIVYAGRIGRGTSNSIVSVAEAVSALGREGADIHFTLYTNTTHDPIFQQINEMDFCTSNPPFPHAEAPKLLSKADLLVLPIDFDEDNFKYIRLSMPTKFSEYMASGTPVLVYSPSDSALAKYAGRYDCASLVTSGKGDALKSAIHNLFNDPSLREKLGRKGMEVSFANHNSEHVRELFRHTLMQQVATPVS